jgi:hypothetical protein
VPLRKGDVALLCSDGLHGPVSDEEILSVLVTEPDLQKAGEGLIQKALDRDGPDNITVALARFDGEALKAPAPEDTVSFMAYDPGSDPVPEPMGSHEDSGLGRETLEERLPTGLLGGGEGEDELPTKTEPADPATIRATRRDLPTTSAPRGVPSLLALFLIGLVFAAAGGIFFMKCERDQSARSDGHVTLP